MHKLLKAVPRRGHLILVGDIDQLPSVGPGMVLSNHIECSVAPIVRLTEFFRQAAKSRIIVNAHRMPKFSDQAQGSDFYFVEREEPERIQSTLITLMRASAAPSLSSCSFNSTKAAGNFAASRVQFFIFCTLSSGGID